MPGIALYALEEERSVEPILRRIEVSDGMQPNFGIDVFGEVEMETALEHTLTLDQSFVLGLQLLLAENDRYAFVI